MTDRQPQTHTQEPTTHQKTDHHRRREERRPPEQADEKKAMEYTAGGSTAEAVCALGALTLAILALLNVLPFVLASIATIAAGGALLLKGGAIASQYSKVLSETRHGRYAKSQVESGVSVEILGGLAGVTLGVLALVGVVPEILIACAVITFGGTLLIGSGTTARLNDITMGDSGASRRTRRVTRNAVQGASGGQILVGLGAMTLGVLSLIGIGVTGFILSTVALIAVGASELVSGMALTGRMVSLQG